MLSILYLLFFLAGGLALAWLLLPRLKPVLRSYIGLSLGLLLMMWLPVLWAYGVRFGILAHGLAAGTLLLLCIGAWFLRDRRASLPFDGDEKKLLLTLALLVIPLGIVGGYLEYTHSIRQAADGSLHVGQSTYGDLSLHLAVTTSIIGAKFPLQNSLMPGATMAYPYLSDSFASTLCLFGMELNDAMAFSGTLMLVLTFTGYALLCAQLCRKKGGMVLAFFLLFLNGGLGFFHTLCGSVENGVTTTLRDNLNTVMTGYYKTPTNQPDPYNLRWVNMICDMFVPQRGILGGWTMLMPCLNLLIPPLVRPEVQEKHSTRSLVLLGVFAGGLPLLHTHSYLALVLFSLGACIHSVFTAPKRERWQAFRPWLLYASVAAALSVPQLVFFTFRQATGSDHFLRFQFNWCNNRGNRGLVDNYFWFYIKNIGLPYLLILIAAFRPLPGEKQRPLRRRLAGAMILLLGLMARILSTELLGTADTEWLELLYNGLYVLCIPLMFLLGMSLLLHKPEVADENPAPVANTDGSIPEDAIAILPDAETLEAEETRAVKQNRRIALGAFLILLIAEFILFQPNEYDNNKLIYVWFALCLPMAADYAMEIWQKLKGLAGRRVIAALFLVCCFLSAGLTVAREWVSDYQAYSRRDVEVAEFIKDNTPEHSVWLTGNQHLNPVASLAGRTVVLSTDSYLYYHGFNTYARRQEVRAMWEDPVGYGYLFDQYDVDYIYISSYERNSDWFSINYEALDANFTLIYDNGEHRIYQVKEDAL